MNVIVSFELKMSFEKITVQVELKSVKEFEFESNDVEVTVKVSHYKTSKSEEPSSVEELKVLLVPNSVGQFTFRVPSNDGRIDLEVNIAKNISIIIIIIVVSVIIIIIIVIIMMKHFRWSSSNTSSMFLLFSSILMCNCEILSGDFLTAITTDPTNHFIIPIYCFNRLNFENQIK